MELDYICRRPSNISPCPFLKKYYTENILVRPYVTIGTTTFYGAAKEQSLYNAAKASADTDNPIIREILSADDSNT